MGYYHTHTEDIKEYQKQYLLENRDRQDNKRKNERLFQELLSK